MKQCKLGQISLEANVELSRLLDKQREAISAQISNLSYEQQLEYIKMLKADIESSRKKIDANFVPDKIKRVFDIVSQHRGVQRKVLLDFLIHVHMELVWQGDLTPEAVIGYLDENQDATFPRVGEKLLRKIRIACREDITRESK